MKMKMKLNQILKKKKIKIIFNQMKLISFFR